MPRLAARLAVAATTKSGLDVVDSCLGAVVAGLAGADLECVAVAAAGTMPAGSATRRLRIAGIALLGGFAVAATVWQTHIYTDRISNEELGSAAQTKQVQVLEDQIDTLKQSTKRRTISADTGGKLADYLRPFGTRQVMVSCSPGDIEAYHYATEIVNVLKSANWDARGPETTTIFGDIKSMAINVYDKQRWSLGYDENITGRTGEIRHPLSESGSAERGSAGQRDGRTVHRHETDAVRGAGAGRGGAMRNRRPLFRRTYRDHERGFPLPLSARSRRSMLSHYHLRCRRIS